MRRGSIRFGLSVSASFVWRCLNSRTVLLSSHTPLIEPSGPIEVAFSVIALWLGHESPVTTHTYIEADIAMKENALLPQNSVGADVTCFV